MKRHALDEFLKKLEVPSVIDAVKERALHRAQMAFANRGDAPMPATAARWQIKALLTLCCAIVMLISILRLTGGQHSGTSDMELLSQLESLFPGQLEGVIISGEAVDLDLSEAISAADGSQRLALTFRKGNQTVRVLGYSGRKVCVDLGGRKRCLEPLATADGKVIVEGEDFLWIDARSSPVAGYKMEACLL